MTFLKGWVLRLAITISASSSFLLFGYDQGVMGNLINQPSLLISLGYPSAVQLGLTVSLLSFGQAIGSVFSAFYGFKLGRRRSIFVGCCVFVVGAVLQTSSFSVGQFIAGRLIAGFGIGIHTSTIPMYIAEMSSTKRRGSGVCTQFSIVLFGMAFAFWVDYGSIQHLSGSTIWRFPIGFQLVFGVFTLLTILFLPDTPQWLYAHGRQEEALTVICRLFDCPRSDYRVLLAENELRIAVSVEHESEKLKLKSFFNDKTDLKTARRLVLCVLLLTVAPWIGISIMPVYTTTLLIGTLHFSLELSTLISGFILIAFWVGSVISVFIADRIGRRKILLWGSVLMTIVMVTFTIAISFSTTPTANLGLAMILLFMMIASATWNPVVWILAPEITPLSWRHMGMAIASTTEYLWSFLSAPSGLQNIGWKLFIINCIICAIGFPLVYFCIPETRNRTLEEIDYLFATGDTKLQLERRFEEAREAARAGDASAAEGEEKVAVKINDKV